LIHVTWHIRRSFGASATNLIPRESKVPEQVLEANQKGLQKCLKGLADLKCANKNGNRVRKDNPQAEPLKLKHKLAKQINMVFKEFSGHSFISDGGKGRGRIYTWRLKALPDLPLLSQMITAVTPQAPRPQDGIGQLVGPLSRRLNNLHLSQQDPEVLLMRARMLTCSLMA